MENLSKTIIIFTTLFLTGYWVVIFLLSYHLIRFGIGTAPRRMAFIMVLGSVFFTILNVLLISTL